MGAEDGMWTEAHRARHEPDLKELVAARARWRKSRRGWSGPTRRGDRVEQPRGQAFAALDTPVLCGPSRPVFTCGPGSGASLRSGFATRCTFPLTIVTGGAAFWV